ncbi:MAG: PTS sugar transporter subunit IIA [marine benthic group bacterium]|jgi:mannitol/fructose-specific phosphotransferase system IIA component (Ntr-type)|nr:PTS sugar transporter subunit IIA [Candidatus Benthicola marisminoris]
MTLSEYLAEDRIIPDVKDDDVRGILRQLLAPVVEAGEVARPEVVLAALLAREKVLSTGVGHGIAIPHAISTAIPDPQVLVGICRDGADYRSMDGEPVHAFFVLLSPPDRAGHHTRLLARIARLARDPSFVEGLRECDSSTAAIEHISRYESTHG